MAYTITLTDGTHLATVQDGTTDTTHTELTLIGKNFAGYGQFLNENFVQLLENFANSTAPSTPLTGQLWWNALSTSLQVYTGTDWKGISSTAAQATAPGEANIGDLWWDTVNLQLKVLSTLPSTWTLIGPQYSSGQGQTGAIATTVIDTGLTEHIVVEFFVNDVVVGILSKDTPAYIINSPPNFSTINPGLTLAEDPAANYQFTGNVTNAFALGNVLAANYLRNDQSGTIAGNLRINNAAGLFVGNASELSINTTGGNVNVAGQALNKNINFSVNVGSIPTTELVLDATLGVATVPNISSVSPGSSITNKNYVDNAAFNSVDLSGNIVSVRSGTITSLASLALANIVTVSAATYRSAEFLIQATDNVTSTYQTTRIVAIQDGTTAYSTEYGSVASGNIIATYSSHLFGGNTGTLAIQATPATTNNTTFKITTLSVTK